MAPRVHSKWQHPLESLQEPKGLLLLVLRRQVITEHLFGTLPHAAWSPADTAVGCALLAANVVRIPNAIIARAHREILIRGPFYVLTTELPPVQIELIRGQLLFQCLWLPGIVGCADVYLPYLLERAHKRPGRKLALLEVL